MWADRVARVHSRPQWLCAGLAFLVTLVFGGLGGGFIINTMYRSAVDAMGQEATVYGESVARTIAAQYAKAGQYEIPLEAVPGTQAYLARLLKETPGITHITLEGPVLGSVGATPAGTLGKVQAPIVANERTLGYIAVQVDPARLTDQAASWFGLFAVGVVGLAIAAAVLAWYGPGADLQQRRQRLLDGLQQGLAALPDSALREYAGKRGDPLDAALQALVDGESAVRDRLVGFDALAQELLAVDFDDRQAPEIERLRSAARGTSGSGAS